MSFEAFELAIKSPALKHVARHWAEVRGSRTMPAWSDIRPAQIAGQLTIIWSYTYDRSADAFTGRLAGARIEQKFNRSLKDVPMKELYPEKDYKRLFARAKRVVCGPQLYRGEGMVFQHLNHFGYGERIILPLADDGVHGDGIFGATDYQAFRSMGTTPHLEADNWFAV
ncbi:MAG: PAS domain-containing protein [Alphaproteobacteria bacterium]|nr:PAS domain-containing protein [Alphaproteobacteria bacterium]